MTNNSKELQTKDMVSNIVSLHDFYFETPLYTEIINENFAENVLQGSVDGINPISHNDTTYDIVSRNQKNYVMHGIYSLSVGNDEDCDCYYFIKLKCRRNNTDCLFYLIYQDDEKTIKLGQNPSLADIQFNELGKKYVGILDKNNMFLFKRAVGLAAHGTGAGSLVYLRRIFEGLIKEAYDQHKGEIDIEQAAFFTKRMNEKVEVLADFLPDELVEMKPLYGVLSQGVHELTEEDCLKYFPALKLSIELILDGKIEEAANKKRANEVKKQLKAVQLKVGGK